MDKQSLQTLKGFRDFLPKEAKVRASVLDKIKKTFELFGFEPLETPALEYKEVLLGKYGDDADKLVYTFEDKGGRGVALRYDQTVPTARVLALYQQELPMPWRRYQIQPVWRAENPQSGRFREFLQCDADIYASSSPLADAEVIALTNSVFKSLGFNQFKIYINDRNILFELMNYASIPQELHLATIAAIDKLDRKTKDETKADLITMGLSETSVEHLFHHMDEATPTENIQKIIKNSKDLGVDADKIFFEARLARGLDYYTSTIFEIKIEDYKGGSVAGGGRYDNLIEQLSGISVPAVGISFGFDRIIEAMIQTKLIPDQSERSSCLIAVFNDELAGASTALAKTLRENGIPCEIYPDTAKDLFKQLKYADKKLIKWLVVIGPEESEKNTVILKDLVTGHQEELKPENLINKITKESQEPRIK